MTTNDYYDSSVKSIKSIKFSIYDNEKIIKHSVISEEAGITIVESGDNHLPKRNSLLDLRLGTCDFYNKCLTCDLDSFRCPGHFGHIKLAKPVFHFGFLNHIKNLLQLICIKCSCVIFNKSEINLSKFANKSPENRFKDCKILSKNVTKCPICNVSLPKIKREIKETGTIKIIVENTNVNNEENNAVVDEQIEFSKKIKTELTADECKQVFDRISFEDMYLLGFDHTVNVPSDMIISIFPVSPVSIRPTARIDLISSASKEDSLTLNLANIVYVNNKYISQLEKENSKPEYISDLYDLLHYHIVTIYDNETLPIPRSEFRSGSKNLKSISDRIKGKYGRLRANIMGKRVDFSARTVITSDAYIDIDQVGIPRKIAMDLTFPEEVTKKNIKYLSKLVSNGRDRYPGANYVIKKKEDDYQRIDLKYRSIPLELSYGDIVERHIINDDYVLFNRQPTLHKPSMMGHRVQVLNCAEINTFRINVSVCKPYNADFDGDEMNAHLPQSIQSRNEIARITNVKKQIISSKDSNPIIGCQQDTISGAYTLSTNKSKLSGFDLSNLLSNTDIPVPKKFDKNKKYTGLEAFSFIIEDGINILKKSGEKVTCKISNGIMEEGILDKSLLSFSKNSIIHFTWNKYGSEKTRRFIDNTQKFILNFLLMNGQTIGFGDVIVNNETNKKINDIIANTIIEYNKEIYNYENSKNIISQEVIEFNLSNILKPIQANVGQILLSTLNNENFFYLAAKSGARGSSVNVAQVMGLVGQQMLGGSRIKKIRERTSIYFPKYTDIAQSRGFVVNSLLKGLDPFEFFINVSAGREGLIDTSIKTSKTGYIQRQLIKILEDLSVKYDNTIRNFSNTAIQLVYGENGIDQSIQTEILLSIVGMNNKQVKDNLCLSKEESNKLLKQFKDNKSAASSKDNKSAASSKDNKSKSKSKSKDEKSKSKSKEKIEHDLTKESQDDGNDNSKPKINSIDEKGLTDFNNNLYNKLIDFRDQIRKIQFKATLNYQGFESKFSLPVNLTRITQDYSTYKEYIDPNLSPIYIVDQIEDFISDINYRIIANINKKDHYMKKNDSDIKFLLKIALYEYLCPKKCYFTYGITKINFDNMMKDIKHNFIKAIVAPGEMVGIIAAQSIGEPTSQLSVSADSLIKIKSINTKEIKIYTIEDFYNKVENQTVPENIYNIPNHINSTEIFIQDKDYRIMSVSKDGLGFWNKISHISRHPPNGKMMKVTTESGRSIKTTCSHSHLVYNRYEISPILGSELVVGMRIPVNKLTTSYNNIKQVVIEDIKYQLTCDKLPIMAANELKNTNSKDLFGKLFNNYKLPDFIYDSPKIFKILFLQTLFDNESSVPSLNILKHIKLINNNNTFLVGIMNLLSYFSIFSIFKNNSLIIPKEYLLNYTNNIGSTKYIDTIDQYYENKSNFVIPQRSKYEMIDNITEIINKCNDSMNFKRIANKSISKKYIKKNIFHYATKDFDHLKNEYKSIRCSVNSTIVWDPIKRIEYYYEDEDKYVYDFTVPNNQTFMIDNGIYCHNTLNTKHHAGAASKSTMNTGVPRIEELLHTTKNIKTPQMRIYLTPSDNNEKQINIISSHLKHFTINDLSSMVELYYEVNKNDNLGMLLTLDNTSSPYYLHVSESNNIDDMNFVIRIKLDVDKLISKEITIIEIKVKFISFWLNKLNNTKNLKKNEKKVIQNLINCVILSNDDNSNYHILHIRFNLTSLDYGLLIEFLNISIDGIILKGISGIKDFNIVEKRNITFNKDTGDVEDTREKLIETFGINIEKLRYFKNIDRKRTSVNDIHTVYRLYGIEAARHCLLNELVFTYQNSETAINRTHLSLLVDQMCYIGEMISVNRHSMNKLDGDPISKASFEKTMDHFVNAALFNETDSLTSVSSRIALGKVIRGGTGSFDIVLDIKKVKEIDYDNEENNTYKFFIKDPLMAEG